MPETLEVLASTSSDFLFNETGASYATAHDAATGSLGGALSFIRIGQRYNSGGALQWAVARGGLIFPTGALQDTGTILGAHISLFCDTIRNTQSSAFNIVVVSGADLADPLVTADYGDLRTRTVSRGLIAVADLVVGSYNNIELDATAISEISKTSNSFFALRSSRDISSTAPVNANDLEDVDFTDAQQGGGEPKLVITYEALPRGYLWVEDTDAPINRVHFTDPNQTEHSILATADVDNTPVDGATTAPISSNWAYDYEQLWEDKKKLVYLGL